MRDLLRTKGEIPPLPGSETRNRLPPANKGALQPIPLRISRPAATGGLLTYLVRPAALLSVLVTEYRHCRSKHIARRGGSAGPQVPAEPIVAETNLVLQPTNSAVSARAAERREVFISYSSRDRQVADMLCATLEANHLRCWIAPRDLVAGSDWSESIISAIVNCRVMVLVLSAGSNESTHVKREVERAAFHRKVVIPLRTEPMQPSASLEYFISLNHWFDASTQPLAPHFTRLAETIRSICDGAPKN